MSKLLFEQVWSTNSRKELMLEVVDPHSQLNFKLQIISQKAVGEIERGRVGKWERRANNSKGGDDLVV